MIFCSVASDPLPPAPRLDQTLPPRPPVLPPRVRGRPRDPASPAARGPGERLSEWGGVGGRGAGRGGVERAQVEVSTGSARYEAVHEAVVWKVDLLPARDEGRCQGGDRNEGGA